MLFISENIICILDIYQYTLEKDLEATFISIWFYKAFDTVEWSVIEAPLNIWLLWYFLSNDYDSLYK